MSETNELYWPKAGELEGEEFTYRFLPARAEVNKNFLTFLRDLILEPGECPNGH